MSSLEARENVYGSALGPDWAANLPIKGISSVCNVLIKVEEFQKIIILFFYLRTKETSRLNINVKLKEY